MPEALWLVLTKSVSSHLQPWPGAGRSMFDHVNFLNSESG